MESGRFLFLLMFLYRSTYKYVTETRIDLDLQDGLGFNYMFHKCQ